MICKYILLLCGLPFYSVGSFDTQKVLIFMECSLFVFFFFYLCFWRHIQKNHCHTQPTLWYFFLFFFLKTFIILVPTFKSSISFESIFVHGVKKGSIFYSFAYEDSVFSAPFGEKIVLSPLNDLAKFPEDHWTIYINVSFWTLISSIGQYVCLYVNIILFLFL